MDSESVLSQYIPFSKTRIVSYKDSVIPSHVYICLEEKLRRLKLEVPLPLCIVLTYPIR